MGKKVLAVLAGVVIMLSFVSCKKEEEGRIPGPPSPGIMMPPGETQIVVPDFVKDKWKAVKLSIDDKIANKTDDVVINIGGEYAIPESNLKIKINDFLPDFIMDGLTITSKSGELNNPAVNIVVLEGDVELFKGWLYSKYPAIHPFQHEKYGLMLKEAVQEG
jgi:hypothetical protein